MAKDEKTSRRVASSASKLLKDTDSVIVALKAAKRAINTALRTLIISKSIAASALTQAPNRKKKR